MPRSIADLRKAAGGLDNLTDEQIVKASYPDFQKYYGTEDEYAKAIGYGGAGRGLTMSRLSAGVDSYQGQLYGAAESLARSAGMDGVADAAGRGRKANKDAADYASARAKEQGGIDDFRDVRGPMSFGNYAGGLAAQSLPQMAAQATGGFLGGLVGGVPGAIAGGAAVGYSNAFADITDNQGEQTENQPGGRRTDPLSAALYAAPYAAVDAFTGVGGKITRGLSRVAGAVEKPVAKESLNFLERGLNDITGFKGGAARVAYTGVKDGVVEGAGETFQELMNQGGRMAVDPNAGFLSDDAQKRYLDSAVGGGVLGSLLGGAGNRGRRYGLQPAAAPAPSSDVLAATEGAPPLQLGLDRNVGTSINGQVNQDPYYVFPDGSTALNSDAAVGAANAPQMGSRDGQREARQEMNRPDVLPDVSQVDGLRNAAGTNADNVLMNDPGAIIARQRAIEMQQRAQAIKDESDRVAAEIESRNQRATIMGLDPKKKVVMELFDQLEAAHDAGTIDDVGMGQSIGQLKVNESGKVRKMFKDIEKTAADKTASAAAVQSAADLGAAADAQTAQTNLAALQPKAPDATPATAATPQSAAQTDAAPKAPASPVATAAPASGDNVPAAQPKPAAAAAVEKVTPATRAVKLLDKLDVPHDKPVKVTRRVNGKDATMEVNALDNWTQLMSTPQVAGRAMKALGIDSEGNQVASPMSFAKIGEQENPPVSREAVRKQLARHGINEATVNAAVSAPGAMDARSGTALAEAADATGIVAVPKESDITATDGEILPQAPSGGKGTFGVREEDSLSKAAGSGLVQGSRETSAQKMSRVQGDNLIKTGQDAQEKVDAPTAEDIRQAEENQRRADARNAAILNHPSADEARVDWDESKQADSPSYAELKPQVRAAFVTEHAEQVADTGNRWAPIQNLITRFEKELDDGDYTKVSRDAPVPNRAARVDGSTAGAAPGRTDRAGGDTAAVQPETGGQISGDAAGARSAESAAQPTVVVKKRRTVERSDAPDRPTALIELRKRESILRSLIKCMGG